jgi:hypothetical protein
VWLVFGEIGWHPCQVSSCFILIGVSVNLLVCISHISYPQLSFITARSAQA